MRRWLKLLLIWMVSLALPLQGMAAVTMLACGPNHHGAPQAEYHAPAAQAPDLAHAADEPVHQHAAEPDTAPAEPGAHEAQPDAGTCSACAACCAPIALPGGLPALPNADLVSRAIAAPMAGAQPFVTDSPERPPRFALA